LLAGDLFVLGGEGFFQLLELPLVRPHGSPLAIDFAAQSLQIYLDGLQFVKGFQQRAHAVSSCQKAICHGGMIGPAVSVRWGVQGLLEPLAKQRIICQFTGGIKSGFPSKTRRFSFVRHGLTVRLIPIKAAGRSILK